MILYALIILDFIICTFLFCFYFFNLLRLDSVFSHFLYTSFIYTYMRINFSCEWFQIRFDFLLSLSLFLVLFFFLLFRYIQLLLPHDVLNNWTLFARRIISFLAFNASWWFLCDFFIYIFYQKYRTMRRWDSKQIFFFAFTLLKVWVC